jgi:hypothetical protein
MSHNLSTLNTACTITPIVAFASPKTTQSRKSFNIFSRLYWSTKIAFDNFIEQFQDFMSSLFETIANKNVVSGNEKGNIVNVGQHS